MTKRREREGTIMEEGGKGKWERYDERITPPYSSSSSLPPPTWEEKCSRRSRGEEVGGRKVEAQLQERRMSES